MKYTRKFFEKSVKHISRFQLQLPQQYIFNALSISPSIFFIASAIILKATTLSLVLTFENAVLTLYSLVEKLLRVTGNHNAHGFPHLEQ